MAPNFDFPRNDVVVSPYRIKPASDAKIKRVIDNLCSELRDGNRGGTYSNDIEDDNRRLGRLYFGMKDFYDVLDSCIYIAKSAPGGGDKLLNAKLKIGKMGYNNSHSSSKNFGDLINACIKKTTNKLRYYANKLTVLDSYCRANPNYNSFADLVSDILKIRVVVVGQNKHELTNSNRVY